MRRVYGRVGYELGIVELEPDHEIRRDELAIRPFAVSHRGTAYGYALVEDSRPGRFDAELAAASGRPSGAGLRPPPARRDDRSASVPTR